MFSGKLHSSKILFKACLFKVIFVDIEKDFDMVMNIVHSSACLKSIKKIVGALI